MDFTRLIKDRTSETCAFSIVRCRIIQMLAIALHAGLNDREVVFKKSLLSYLRGYLFSKRFFILNENLDRKQVVLS